MPLIDSHTFSPDGRFLFGSSYYTGVSNIFRYELTTQDLQAVSNSETGMFQPIPLDNENLIVFRYSGAGPVPAKIVAEIPVPSRKSRAAKSRRASRRRPAGDRDLRLAGGRLSARTR